MLNPLFKIILLGSSLMSMARCSVSDLINGGDSEKSVFDFFAVKINNQGDGIILKAAEKDYFSYYSIDGKHIVNTEIAPLEQNTFDNLPSAELLDNEETSYTYGANMSPDGNSYKSLLFFKYTFFIKNESSPIVKYKWSLDFEETGKGTSMLHVLRSMVFENSASSDEHNYSVFAKESADGNQELISTPEYGYAQKFESDSMLASSVVSGFRSHDIMRYTVVIWIEGNDPECTNDYYSDGFKDNFSFKFNINAKEE